MATQCWITRHDQIWTLVFAIGLVAGRLHGALPEPSDRAPISIAREGYLFAGGKYSFVGGRQVMSGQLYAEFQIPSRQTHRYPIVMIHGGSQSGTNFIQTPDGREGWAQFFLRKGYAIYLLDQVGRGRAAYQSDLYGPTTKLETESVEERFTTPERYKLYPQAHLHTQWPGKCEPGDPVFDQFFASLMPGIADVPLVRTLNRDAIIVLLQKIGPAILLTHSQSGSIGWLVADAHPELVKAILAVEPGNPPFFDVEEVGPPDWFHDGPKVRPWGIAAVPLNYSPAAENSGLPFVQQEKPESAELARCWLQKSPAKQLPNLGKVPILVVTSEASSNYSYDNCTVKFLRQAGVHPAWTRLGEIGIHGNGHMMMLEKNNTEIAAAMFRWLQTALPNDSLLL